jgi:hypothetical protein
MRERRWASRARGSKGAWELGRGWRTRGRGCVHGGEIVGGRLETADRWGRWDRERESGRGGKERRQQLWPTGQREREGEGALRLALIGGARLSHTGGARAGLSGPIWAEMAFSISREFLIAFLFIFSRVFNSNSNQVSNSNQFKYMQQFK